MQQERGFLRAYVVPALFLFAIPLFAYWFAGHATRSYDETAREAILTSIQSDATLSEIERPQLMQVFQANRVSDMCGTDGDGLGESFAELCSDFQQFEWMRLAAFVSLALGVASVALALGCSALSFVSRGTQYLSFLVGLHTLRVACSLQTLLQGGLAVALSFWMTAVWFERYSVKLVLVIGVLAVLAVFLVVASIFRKVGGPLEVEGVLLREQEAPALWEHIRGMCKRLGTEPPQQIVAGIDDNFFVTEGEVLAGGHRLRGRTLYVSLSLVRTMERSEADAVLAHEMAHFSGGDTAHSKKLVPLMHRCGAYLDALRSGGLSIGIYWFMRFYFALFQVSLGRTKRQREFRADAVAAEITSASDIARALVKVGAYSSYRGRVEESLFAKSDQHQHLGIPARVVGEFRSYVDSPRLADDLQADKFPHPFDTHPSLRARIDAVGARVSEADYPALLSEPVTDSWTSAIADAEAIEARLWADYERRFLAAHERSLAYRYRPATDEERAVVSRHFPPREIPTKNGGVVRMDYAKIEFPEGASVSFGDIKKAEVNERLFKKYLDLRLQSGDKHSLCLGDLLMEADDVLRLFNLYYGRHLTMVEHQKTVIAA